MATASDLRLELANTGAYLLAIADKLDSLADQSLSGGWSTHQVEPQRALADSCRRKAAQLMRYDPNYRSVDWR